MPVRRNASALFSGQRRSFVAAVLELKRRGGYDELVTIHFDRMTADAAGQRIGHQSPSFLPWHRRYLLDFERRLQAIDPTVTLPYWNWTVDRTADAPLWKADFLGGDGRAGDRQVTTGPFAHSTGNWPLTVRVDSREYLVRTLGLETPTLPTPAELAAVLQNAPYDTAPWTGSSVTGLRTALEGSGAPNLHNRVHVWVGGQMLQTVSPNDPVFFLHHAFIDKCWSDWCARQPPGTHYLPTGNTTDVVDLTEPLPPWNDTTPADLIDHRKFYTYN
jgi:tyrosinase